MNTIQEMMRRSWVVHKESASTPPRQNTYTNSPNDRLKKPVPTRWIYWLVSKRRRSEISDSSSFVVTDEFSTADNCDLDTGTLEAFAVAV